MPYEICCIGHTTMDRVITPAGTVCMPGGTAIYFSHAMAALNIRFSLVTSLAECDHFALSSLQKKGVAITFYPSAHSLFFENQYGHNPDERTQKVLEVADPFITGQLTGTDASVYHLGTLLAGDIPGEAIKALATKGKISLDVQGYLRRVEKEAVLPADWKQKEELLPYVHYLKANEEEAAVLTDEKDIEKAAKKLLDWGVKEVIITCGSRGSVVYTPDAVYSIPAFNPAVLTDATGCGDTYMAGYLYKRCKGASIQEAGEFAAAMATLKIQKSGPFTGTEEEVNNVLHHAEKSNAA